MNNGIIRMADELRRLAAIFAAIFAATLTPVLAADIPSCDAFIKRFEDAPHVLSLKQMKRPSLDLDQELARDAKKLKDEKNPAYYGKNPVLIPPPDQVYDFHDDESDTDLSVYCRNEKFSSLSLFFYRPTSSWYRTTSKRPAPHPYLDYIASGIYGATGWPVGKVMKTAADIWQIKLGMRAIKPSDPDYQEAAAAELAGDEKYVRWIKVPGLCATISWDQFTIGDCVEHKY
jgi:hypothetical protein